MLSIQYKYIFILIIIGLIIIAYFSLQIIEMIKYV
jgi:hypothetical protein